MTQETVTNGTEALFTREGMPPVKEMIPCALQHVLASFAGIITPAVIMAGVYGFNSQQSTDIIQVALILSAIDTALQAFAPFRRIGGGLPIVMGVSFAFLPALQAMGASGFSFGALLGGEIVGGAVAVLFGLAYSKIKWLFPPVVTGTVIFSIGVSLYPTAVKYMAGGMGTPLWGTPQAWCVALITFAVVFALANFGKGTLKLGSVFFGMIVGMIVSIPFGMIDFSSVATAQVFALPKLMPYALEFDPEVCITLAVVFPMVAIQIIGDVSAACLGSIDRMPTERELSGAIVSQGLTSMVGGLLQQGRQQVGLCDHRGRLCHRRPVPAALCRPFRYPAARHRRRDRRRLWHHHHERRAHVHPRGPHAAHHHHRRHLGRLWPGYLDGQRLPCRRGYARLGVHRHRLQCRNPHRHHGHCP